jgi:hypothetical protein
MMPCDVQNIIRKEIIKLKKLYFKNINNYINDDNMICFSLNYKYLSNIYFLKIILLYTLMFFLFPITNLYFVNYLFYAD